MTVEELTSSSQGRPGLSSPVLPQLAPLVLHVSHSHKSKLLLPFPSASHLPAHSAQGELEMEWPQLFRVLEQAGIDGSLQLWSKGWEAPRPWEERFDLAKKNPNVDCSSWHEEGHPITWCHPAGKHSSRVMVGNSLRKGKVKYLCPAANPPQQPVLG